MHDVGYIAALEPMEAFRARGRVPAFGDAGPHRYDQIEEHQNALAHSSDRRAKLTFVSMSFRNRSCRAALSADGRTVTMPSRRRTGFPGCCRRFGGSSKSRK